MKNLITCLILLLFLSFNLYSQDASSYFPSSPGFTWNYKVVPLDSANNEIDTLAYYKVDSFAVAQNYKGMMADVIVSKIGISGDVPFAPFDTSYFSFQGSDAYEYFSLFNVGSIIGSQDVNSNPKLFKKIFKTEAFEGWFAFFKFASSENTSYQILSKDTTLVVDSASYSLRLIINGKRLPDQVIQTAGQQFSCKRFVVDNVVNLLLSPTLAVPILTISDTSWIASNQWIVQDIIPSVSLDLSSFGISKIFIPGSKTTLVAQLPTGIAESGTNVKAFQLYQNYPNPFNPATRIKYSLSKNSSVELTVYDLLGNKVVTLVDQNQNAGIHEVEFNPSNINGGLSTGVYFYQLKTNSGILTKKLMYLK